jgi:hypothetical protein
MRYEEIRRPRGMESFWLRLKVWLGPDSPKRTPLIRDLRHLSERERCDIGLPEPVRYVDWRALRDEGWL